MPLHLLFSPHLDDATLSLGALMPGWRRSEDQIVVATIFSAPPEGKLSAGAEEDLLRYEGDPITIRMAEDDRSAAVLGFEVDRLGLREVLFRWRPDGRARCESLDDIFGDTEADDETTIAAVADVAAAAIAKHKPNTVFAPLGLGNHIDHTIARRGIERAIVGLPLTISYYRDMPYALDSAPILEPAGAARVPWAVDKPDIEQWIKAVECYPTQLSNMFGGADWQSRFRDWAVSTSAYYLTIR